MADGTGWILGVNAYDHDVSAALLRDGVPVVAIAKERLTRVKHDAGFYGVAVDACLEAAGISLDDVDLVVRDCYVLPVEAMERHLRVRASEYHLPHRERPEALRHPLFGAAGPRVATVSHHLAHACSAFALSPFREGVVMVVDGVGSYRGDVTEPVPADSEAPPLAREAESWYSFRDGAITPLRKFWLPSRPGLLNEDFFHMEGLGALYSRVSTYAFGDWNLCGEVMGLAPYGRPGLEPLVRLEGDRLVFREWPPELCHPFPGGGDAVWEASPFRPEREDLARRIQEDAEEVLLGRARALHAATGAENLCLAGGVALNCVANGRIVEETPFRNVWIQPAAGDDGIALGAALHGHLALRGGRRPPPMRSASLGPVYPPERMRAAASGALVRAAAARSLPADLPRRAAALLARGKVLGWVRGGSEFGPRALGNRAILADPRDAAMKDHVNARVKHRQAFRPFAPVVTAERAGEFFEGAAESPFMLLAKKVKPAARGRIPAVVHVDGTARVQTVRKEDDPLLHALLEAFDAVAGVPVLLLTSFNLRGEPLVETPEDAVECFLRSRLDALVLGDLLLEKRLLARPFHPLVRSLAWGGGSLRSEGVREKLLARLLGG
jgi:carbamoyltransferase